MEKKQKWLIIGVLFILLIVVGFFAYNNIITEKHTIQIGDTRFELPSGYSKEKISSTEGIIKNGTDTIGIQEYGDNDLKKHVNEYKVNKEKEGESLNISSYNVNNTKVYKSINVNNTRFVHYWFVNNNNNKVYSVYTWHANNNTDNIVANLINSARSK